MPEKPNQYTHFEADFNDGTTYIQGTEDLSIDTEGKNAFYDILQREKEVVEFRVIKEDGNEYSVNLRTGKFAINGLIFSAHDQFYNPSNKTLKLIYFKEMHQNFRFGEQDPYEVKVNRYFIGWECKNKSGKNVKQTIAIES